MTSLPGHALHNQLAGPLRNSYSGITKPSKRRLIEIKKQFEAGSALHIAYALGRRLASGSRTGCQTAVVDVNRRVHTNGLRIF